MSEVGAPAALDAHFQGRIGGFALDVAFITLARGITALIGPSGSGKSTLLRCIAGLTRMSGHLTVGGETWQDGAAFTPPHRRPVGMVFQDAGLLAHLSVRENLMFGARRAKVSQGIAFDDIVELLGLASLLTRSTTNLSGGERQRVALGRALLSQPRLLLMDEPLSSLDDDSKAEIAPYLERLHDRLTLPVIYVSHDLDEVYRLADHLLVMKAGRIVEARPNVRAGSADVASREAAETRLGLLDTAAVSRLALAALLAGLDPA
ncbi:hypothetical protein BH11PSE2_BH11PSE2_16840 [soil metagenome]